MVSVKNWKFRLSLFLDKMSLEIQNVMSDDHPSRKLALLNYKHIYVFFSKGLTYDFRQKLLISSVFFDSISLEIMSDDHLVKQIWISCSHDTEFF